MTAAGSDGQQQREALWSVRTTDGFVNVPFSRLDEMCRQMHDACGSTHSCFRTDHEVTCQYTAAAHDPELHAAWIRDAYTGRRALHTWRVRS